jgi:hypothetical protein
MADTPEIPETPQKYGLWDTKFNSWVRGREYDSLKNASRAGDKLDNQYGAYRYTVKPIGSTGGGSSVGGGFGLKPGQSPSLDTPIKEAKGGMVSASKRADGIAQRGKTRGKVVKHG